MTTHKICPRADERAVFLRSVLKTSTQECWLWIRGKHTRGYGIYYSPRDRTKPRGYRGTLAHRAAYEIFIGYIPRGAVVRHSCDNTELWDIASTLREALYDLVGDRPIPI